MYSLFSPEVLACGAISGGAYVVILLIRAFADDMLAGLRWLWNEIAGFLLIIAPLAALMLVLWLLSGHSWSHTVYRWIGYAIPFITLLVFAFINGANRGRK